MRRPNQLPDTPAAHVNAPLLSEYHEVPSRKPQFRSDVAAIVLMATGLGFMLGWSLAKMVETFVSIAEHGEWALGIMFGSIAGGVTLVWRVVKVLDRPVVEWLRREWQTIGKEKEEKPVGRRRWVEIIDSSSGELMRFQEPVPAEFSTWMRQYLGDLYNTRVSPREKVSLSQNTGKNRGWPTKLYRIMRGVLIEFGCAYVNSNNTLTLTDKGVDLFNKWLQMDARKVVGSGGVP